MRVAGKTHCQTHSSASVRVLLHERRWQRYPARPRRQIVLVLSPHDREVPSEIGLHHSGKHGDAVLIALAASNDDLVRGELQVLNPEPAALEHAKAGTVQEGRHEARRALEPLEHGPDLIAAEHDGQA
jgi:hypothetical protein